MFGSPSYLKSGSVKVNEQSYTSILAHLKNSAAATENRVGDLMLSSRSSWPLGHHSLCHVKRSWDK